MERKKLVRKTEPPSKRRIAWPKWTGFRNKTVWDFLQLLIVPLMLAAIGFWFTVQQDARQQQIENQRAEAERELGEQRAQDEALQAYLDQMSSLLLEKDLRASEAESEVQTLARARTLTVLGRLDPSRKIAVMEFLIEAGLVQSVGEGSPPDTIISLADADLSDTDLGGADLSGADLSGADLSGADLGVADLSRAYLRVADLSDANLRDANLSASILNDADLSRAYLRGAGLSGAELYSADLSDAELSFAELRDANLRGAELGGADLSDADLSGASLSDTDLKAANLNRAYLYFADGVTNEGLEQQAESLEGTIMPDGTIYPGRYAARDFDPALSFSVAHPQRWLASETGWDLFIESLEVEGGQLIFISPSYVYDPSNPSELKEVPAPKNTDEWVSWFQSHPNVDTSEPVPMSVGGASGMRIDVTVTSTPENYPQKFCGEQPCVPLYPSTETGIESPGIEAILSNEEFKDRFVIVDFGGETVIIDVVAPTDRFDEFLPKAQKVLDTVAWKGR